MKKLILISLFVFNVILTFPASATFPTSTILDRVIELCAIALRGRKKASEIYDHTVKNTLFGETTEKVRGQGYAFNRILYNAGQFFDNENDQPDLSKVNKYLDKTKSTASAIIKELNELVASYNLSTMWYQELLVFWREVHAVCSRDKEDVASIFSTDDIRRVKAEILSVRGEIDLHKRNQKKNIDFRRKSMQVTKEDFSNMRSTAPSLLSASSSSGLEISGQSQQKRTKRKVRESSKLSSLQETHKGNEKHNDSQSEGVALKVNEKPLPPPVPIRLEFLEKNLNEASNVDLNHCDGVRRQCVTVEFPVAQPVNHKFLSRTLVFPPGIPKRSDIKDECPHPQSARRSLTTNLDFLDDQ